MRRNLTETIPATKRHRLRRRRRPVIVLVFALPGLPEQRNRTVGFPGRASNNSERRSLCHQRLSDNIDNVESREILGRILNSSPSRARLSVWAEKWCLTSAKPLALRKPLAKRKASALAGDVKHSRCQSGQKHRNRVQAIDDRLDDLVIVRPPSGGRGCRCCASCILVGPMA